MELWRRTAERGARQCGSDITQRKEKGNARIQEVTENKGDGEAVVFFVSLCGLCCPNEPSYQKSATGQQGLLLFLLYEDR